MGLYFILAPFYGQRASRQARLMDQTLSSPLVLLPSGRRLAQQPFEYPVQLRAVAKTGLMCNGSQAEVW